MITGFNTDIEHDGIVYHVQTEDKGLDSPLILSLVYSGGAILASKRSGYEDLIAEGFDEEALADRLKRQHRLICAAINAGRIEDLKKMGAREPSSQTPEPESELESPAEPPTSEFIITDNWTDYEQFTEAQIQARTETEPEAEVSDETIAEPAPPIDLFPEQLVETSPYTIHDSRRQSSETDKSDEGLVLTLLDDQDYCAGQIFHIRILALDCSGGNERPLAGVALSVKILGTSFKPLLHSVKTERDGVAVVSVQIPLFTSGRAAVLIRGEFKGRTAEMRRVIRPALVGLRN